MRTLCAQVCFLDASIQRWASPATDLAYFLFSSVTPMLRETHLVRVSQITFSRIFFFDFFICTIAAGGDPGLLPRRILPLPGKAGGGPGRVPLQVIRKFFNNFSTNF